MATLAISLSRYSPAWCCFMVGFCAAAMALFALCFIGGEVLAIRVMAYAGNGQ